MDQLKKNIYKEIEITSEQENKENKQDVYNFNNFLTDFGILEIAIGTSIGIASKTYLDSIRESIIEPILQSIFNIRSLDDHIVNIFGILFKPGLLFVETLTFALLIFLIYFLVSLILIPLMSEVIYNKKIMDNKDREIALLNALQNEKMYNELKDLNKNIKNINQDNIFDRVDYSDQSYGHEYGIVEKNN